MLATKMGKYGAMRRPWAFLLCFAGPAAAAVIGGIASTRAPELIVLLALLILVTIALFWRIRVAAALLLVPYLLWVLYATALNIALWQRNGAIL